MREILVAYKNVDGLHVFTSSDVRGFYVASMDAREAFEEVSEGLRILMWLNDGVKAQVHPGMDVNEFLRLIGDDAVGAPHPAIIDAARFKFCSRETA